MLAPVTRTKRHFQLVLIKPSHYDADGYVIQWMRSSIPSNSLASVYALAADANARQALGPDVEIDITAMDETNTRVKIKDIVALMKKHDGFGMVGLVGVQSNQFPRSLDIARPLREAGIPVVIGGFHVSGCIAMLPEMQADLKVALAMGCSLFAGEAEEGRLDGVLRDAADGTLQPVYNYMEELPGLEGTPTPFLPPHNLKRTANHYASFDAGRGCPYQCSFCTIINVQGRKSRRRSPDDIEHIVRTNYAQGLRAFFITDDNFARNKDWEPILDRIIHLREVEKFNLSFIIQVDTLCHKLPNFVEKAARAGVKRVFIGLENINPDNLLGAKKRQNKITEYRTMLLAWKTAGVITYAGYILGFPGDTFDSIMHDIDVIKRELPVDLLEFFYLTPLPGSEDHLKLHKAGAWLDPDLNKYDLNHICTPHPKMSREEWDRAYKEAWQRYYTIDHVETILRRVASTKANASNALFLISWFMGSINIERIHPLEGGFLRKRYRRDRRPEMGIEPVWLFYPKHWGSVAARLARWAALYIKLRRIYLRIKNDPNRYAYTDLAMTPVADDEAATHELFATDQARAFVEQRTRLDKLSAGPGRGGDHVEVVEAAE